MIRAPEVDFRNNPYGLQNAIFSTIEHFVVLLMQGRFIVALILVCVAISSSVIPATAVTISASIVSFYPASGNFYSGQSVTSSLTFRNTGNAAWTFYVGYSVIDYNGKSYDITSSAVTLNPGQTSGTVSKTWTVSSGAVKGWYQVAMAVWKNKPETSGAQQPLDHRLQINAFQVVPAPYSFNYGPYTFGQGSVSFFGYEFPTITAGVLLITWKGQTVFDMSFNWYPGTVIALFGTLNIQVVKCVSAYASCSTYYKVAKTLNDIRGDINDIETMINWVLNYAKAQAYASQLWKNIETVMNNLKGTVIANLGTLSGELPLFYSDLVAGQYSQAIALLPILIIVAGTTVVCAIGIINISAAVGAGILAA